MARRAEGLSQQLAADAGPSLAHPRRSAGGGLGQIAGAMLEKAPQLEPQTLLVTLSGSSRARVVPPQAHPAASRRAGAGAARSALLERRPQLQRCGPATWPIHQQPGHALPKAQAQHALEARLTQCAKPTGHGVRRGGWRSGFCHGDPRSTAASQPRVDDPGRMCVGLASALFFKPTTSAKKPPPVAGAGNREGSISPGVQP